MGFFKSIKDRVKNSRKNVSESDWHVVLEDDSIKSIDFENKESEMDVSAISRVGIETNDSGPWGVDFWWRIEGKGKVLWVPNGATGEDDLLREVKGWNGFQLNEFGKAVRSTGNVTFVVWEKG